MLLIGGVLFVAVVVDSVRRVLADRREQLRLSRNAAQDYNIDNTPAPPESPPADADVIPVLMNTVDTDELAVIDNNEPLRPDEPDPLIEQTDLPLASSEPEPEPEPAPQRPPAEEIIVINIQAREAPFTGPALLKCLRHNNMRYGSMEIFHQYAETEGRQFIQFSIANAIEPGTFSLADFDQFSTPGLTCFLQLPGPANPSAAFHAMLTTADELARKLNGVLLDEQRNKVSRQTLEHLRQQVKDFERRQLVAKRQP